MFSLKENDEKREKSKDPKMPFQWKNAYNHVLKFGFAMV